MLMVGGDGEVYIRDGQNSDSSLLQSSAGVWQTLTLENDATSLSLPIEGAAETAVGRGALFRLPACCSLRKHVLRTMQKSLGFMPALEMMLEAVCSDSGPSCCDREYMNAPV